MPWKTFVAVQYDAIQYDGMHIGLNANVPEIKMVMTHDITRSLVDVHLWGSRPIWIH